MSSPDHQPARAISPARGDVHRVTLGRVRATPIFIRSPLEPKPWGYTCAFLATPVPRWNRRAVQRFSEISACVRLSQLFEPNAFALLPCFSHRISRAIALSRVRRTKSSSVTPRAEWNLGWLAAAVRFCLCRLRDRSKGSATRRDRLGPLRAIDEQSFHNPVREG